MASDIDHILIMEREIRQLTGVDLYVRTDPPAEGERLPRYVFTDRTCVGYVATYAYLQPLLRAARDEARRAEIMK